MKRKIVSKDTIGVKDYKKSSSGFIYDTSLNGYVSPQYVKISDHEAEKFYRGNEWVNAVVNRLVDDCTKIPPKITLIDKTKELKPRHQRQIEFVYNFFLRPNPNKESFSQIREKFIKDMLVVGRGTDEKVLDENDILKEIYALKASTMDIMTNKHGMIPDTNAFVQKAKDGKDQKWDKNEIIWTVFRPVSGTAYGEKPLDTLANAVASDILRATYNSNFFLNSAEAGGVLSLEGMSKAELKKFRQYWTTNHKGVNKAHKMVAVNVPIKHITNTITNRDMQFSEYGNELMMKIFAVYSMQPFIMGVINETTGKLNSKEQTQVYKDSALKPILRKEAYTYTTEILHDGFNMHEFQVEFEGVDLADAVTQSEIDRMDINSGILVINEVRSRRGLQPVPWGNTPISVMPGGGQIDPETGLLVPPSEQGNDNSGDDSKRFKVDITESIIHLSKIFESQAIAGFLKSSFNISKYAHNMKQYIKYENIVKELCDKIGNDDNFDFVKFIDERLQK